MKVLRSLDILEGIFLKLQLSKFYGCNIHFTVRYYWDELDHLQQPFSYINISQILFPALEKVISNTPQLCISIKDAKTPNPQFVLLPEIDFSSVVKFVTINSDKEFINISEKELCTEFDLDDETKPFWRIVVGTNDSTTFENSEIKPNFNLCIMFTCNHVIGDGLSAMAFQATLMEAIDEVFLQRETCGGSISKSKLHIDQSTIIANPLSFKSYESIYQPENNPVKIASPVITGSAATNFWMGDVRPCDLPQDITKVHYFSLTEDEFTPILALAKIHKTTIFAVLNMLAFFSIREVVGHALDSQILKVRVPFSLRRSVTPQVPWKEFGNFVTVMLYDFDMVKISSIQLSDNDFKEKFWDLCQSYTLAVRSEPSTFFERPIIPAKPVQNNENHDKNNASNENKNDNLQDTIENCMGENNIDENRVNENGVDEKNTDENGADEKSIDENGANENHVDENGANENCVDEKGVDENSVNKNGVEKNGVYENGVEKNGVNENGVEKNGVNENGVEKIGVNENGVNENDVDENNAYENRLKETGVDKKGINENGMSENDVDKNGAHKNDVNENSIDENNVDENGANENNADKNDENGVDKNDENKNVENQNKTNENVTKQPSTPPLPDKRFSSLNMSNLGRFPVNSSNRKRSDLKVVSLNYSGSAPRFDAVFRINSISYDNVLHICILHQDGSIRDEQMDKFISEFLKISRMIVKEI
ncbi:5815_t:CDS:1 [Racocetra fulgida]|uniref:5815_t:CDS:1 n=1 Tax=Racocetra fulgida TaxID=60492 RepID=A0A9N9H6S6_9GLOM|nr:5815_t:CDS:1 [Racocetra fulgida]